MPRFDLPQILQEEARRNRRRRRRAVVLRPISVPPGIVAGLRQIMLKMPDYFAEAVERDLLPAYEAEIRTANVFRDDAPDRIREQIDKLGEGAIRLLIALTPELANWVLRVDQWHSQRWSRNVKAATGFNPDYLVGSLAAHDEIRSYLQWASSLIRDISDQARRRIEAQIYQGFIDQIPRRQIGKEIQKIINSSRKRANLIARDQANKLSGKMDELRHREAGIKQYRWRTAEDDRVRPTHAANNRKIFSWKKPPVVTGHPRTEINCRCTAEAYIPLLKEVE